MAQRCWAFAEPGSLADSAPLEEQDDWAQGQPLFGPMGCEAMLEWVEQGNEVAVAPGISEAFGDELYAFIGGEIRITIATAMHCAGIKAGEKA